MDLSKYRFRSEFQSIAKIIAPSQEDCKIATASLAPLGEIFPNRVDPEKAPDLLYFSANGAVGGLINKNDDGITGETAIKINETACNKYVSMDHDKTTVVGAILHTGFTQFGSNEPISLEEVKSLKVPFNMAVGGVLWKAIAPMVTKYIYKSGDSEEDEVLSLSWEIAFDSYAIAVGSKNLFEAKIIQPDDKDFVYYDGLLRCNGGSGKDKNKLPVYRVIQGVDGMEPIILGYSIVPNPAAEVKGILAVENCEKPEAQDEKDDQENEKEEISQEKEKIKEKNINTSNISVNNITTNLMKIESIEQLTASWDEIRKQESSAAVTDFVASIKDGAEKWVADLAAKENMVKQAEEARAAAEKRATETEQALAQMRQELEQIKSEVVAAQALASYNERMEALNGEFDLTEEDNSVIASEVKNLRSDEEFAAYQKKARVLLKEKSKSKKAEKKEKVKEGSECEKPEEKTEVKAAIASVTETPHQTVIPNGVGINADLFEQMKSAFGSAVKIDGKPISEAK